MPRPSRAIKLKRRLVYAIDPGTTASGWCLYDPNERRVGKSGHRPNFEILDDLYGLVVCLENPPVIAIESMTNMGMEIGQSTLDSAVWIGRFVERAGGLVGEAWSPEGRAVLIPRRDVKLAMCANSRAKDKNIRQALIDRFGGECHGVGGIKCKGCKGKGWAGRGRPTCEACGGSGWLHKPGPLYGVAGHAWSALAVAVTYTMAPHGPLAGVA